MARRNILEDLENAEDGGRPKRKRRRQKPKPAFRRISTEEKYNNVISINRVEEEPKEKDNKRPVRAKSLHVGEQVSPGREQETVKEAEEEIDIEKEIGEFRDTEKEYISHITRAYSEEFRAAKAKIEKNGGTADEKWLAVFRESYISDRVRWGLDKKRWGSGGPLAPEKAEILKKYLELKLPADIPEKPEENKPENPEAASESKEKNFTPEQMAAIRNLMKISSARFKQYFKESESWEPEAGDEEAKKQHIFDQMKAALGGVMAGDDFLKKMFPEEKIPEAVETIMDFVAKFNMKK